MGRWWDDAKVEERLGEEVAIAAEGPREGGGGPSEGR